ncbi:helix-turn-helix domain-containing protein [Bernardetia sp. Wsw4-3y2]|uniref:helix-turn-helix domain-containing protein n=1 Tax=Bernardetia sp. Wsw4-3y2 TaxID=3127471 RepID=UPI0030CD2689
MLGKKIKKLIDNSDISQTKVALELNISRPTLQRLFERDTIETALLIRLCEIFNVELSYFFTELEGVELPEVKKEVVETKDDYWKVKYLEAQQKVDTLQNEISQLKTDFIEFQKKVFDRMTIELGKDKACIESELVNNNDAEKDTIYRSIA